MKNTMLVLLLALGLVTLLLAALGLYLMIRQDSPQGLSIVKIDATQTSQTIFNRPFTLTGQDGQPVTEKTMLGKPSLYFFGFTHCPDICPTTLGAITGWLNQLGPDAKNLNVLFVSVDPARDTPASLKTYTHGFHPQITGATGTDAQLQAMAKQFMVYYAKVPVKPGENPDNYMVSHSSMIIMADKSGTFMGTLDAHDQDTEALTKLRSLINNE